MVMVKPGGFRSNAMASQEDQIRTWVRPKESKMLHYAVVFLVIALIAAVLGFGGIAASAAGIAKVLFVIFAVLALAGFIAGLLRRG
jgi:uncharacterized membrane protein YtjA (UPF0391 family)